MNEGCTDSRCSGTHRWLTGSELAALKTEHSGCELWIDHCAWCLLVSEVRALRAERQQMTLGDENICSTPSEMVS